MGPPHPAPPQADPLNPLAAPPDALSRHEAELQSVYKMLQASEEQLRLPKTDKGTTSDLTTVLSALQQLSQQPPGPGPAGPPGSAPGAVPHLHMGSLDLGLGLPPTGPPDDAEAHQEGGLDQRGHELAQVHALNIHEGRVGPDMEGMDAGGMGQAQHAALGGVHWGGQELHALGMQAMGGMAGLQGLGMGLQGMAGLPGMGVLLQGMGGMGGLGQEGGMMPEGMQGMLQSMQESMQQGMMHGGGGGGMMQDGMQGMMMQGGMMMQEGGMQQQVMQEGGMQQHEGMQQQDTQQQGMQDMQQLQGMQDGMQDMQQQQGMQQQQDMQQQQQDMGSVQVLGMPVGEQDMGGMQGGEGEGPEAGSGAYMSAYTALEVEQSGMQQ